MRSTVLRFVALYAALHAIAAVARADVFSCSATGEYNELKTTIAADIVIPHPMNMDKALWLLEAHSHAPSIIAATGSTLGSIELVVTASFRDAAKTTDPRKRHHLIVTQVPSSSNSLIAIYFDGPRHPTIVRADVWHASKRFTVAKQGEGTGVQLFVGECR